MPSDLLKQLELFREAMGPLEKAYADMNFGMPFGQQLPMIWFAFPQTGALIVFSRYGEHSREIAAKLSIPWKGEKWLPTTDTERLDWLQSKTTGYGGWVARISTTGRGFRLHESEHPAARPTVREAIDAAMEAEK